MHQQDNSQFEDTASKVARWFLIVTIFGWPVLLAVNWTLNSAWSWGGVGMFVVYYTLAGLWWWWYWHVRLRVK